MKFLTLTTVSIITTLLTGSAFAAENKFTTAYDYTSGKYGQNVTTEIEIVPLTFNRLDGAWNLKLTIPYIRVTGNGTVIPGTTGTAPSFFNGVFGGGGGGGSSTTSTVVNSGLGDITGSIGYGFFPGSNFFEAIAKIKLGTADANKGLGTGENDYSLQLDGVIGNGKVSPFFTAGYVITGDTASTAYKDVPYGSFGFMFKNSDSQTSGISYDYRQATLEGSENQEQFSAFLTWKKPHQWSTTVSGLIGLTTSSPDFGLSLYFTNIY